MVQIQSSWFPLVDRNPQTFVDIYNAKESDFQKATQRVYHNARDAVAPRTARGPEVTLPDGGLHDRPMIRPLGVHVDAFGGGALGESGHPDDVAGERDEEPGTGGDLDVADGQGEAPRTAAELGVIRERVLGLGHADRQLAVAEPGGLAELGRRRVAGSRCRRRRT